MDTTNQQLDQAIESIHNHSMLHAFLLLFSHLVHQQTNLQGVLSVTLEQAINGIQSIGGEIWLAGEDEQLSLRGSSYSAAALQLQQCQQREQIARAIAANRTTQQLALQHGEFLGLGTPLLHADKLLGALILYTQSRQPFDKSAPSFLENLAVLAAPVLESMQLQEKLREHIARQRVLLEMSRQVSDGLSTEEILQRALQWANRLCPMEIGLIGLYQVDSQTLHSIYSFGVPDCEQRFISLNEFKNLQTAVREQKAVLVDVLEHTCEHVDARYQQWLARIRQMVVLPVVYHQNVLAVFVLANKFDGEFTANDLDVLSIAAKVAAIALNNATLYEHTLRLMNDSRQIHQLAIQHERLAIVGRLMRSLAHEINNPLQAVRGAASLAEEDIESPEDLRLYFDIIHRETERVIQLLERMRNIYRESDAPDWVNINQVVQNIIKLSRKELNWQQTQLVTSLSPDPPVVWGYNGQLHIALLNLLLSLNNLIAQTTYDTLYLKTYANSQNVYIVMAVQSPFGDWKRFLGKGESEDISEMGFGLQFSKEIVESHQGSIHIRETPAYNSIVIRLPRDLSRESHGQRLHKP